MLYIHCAWLSVMSSAPPYQTHTGAWESLRWRRNSEVGLGGIEELAVAGCRRHWIISIGNIVHHNLPV